MTMRDSPRASTWWPLKLRRGLEESRLASLLMRCLPNLAMPLSHPHPAGPALFFGLGTHFSAFNVSFRRYSPATQTTRACWPGNATSFTVGSARAFLYSWIFRPVTTAILYFGISPIIHRTVTRTPGLRG